VTAPLRLLPLGTNGYFPTQGRQTMSYLLVAPGGDGAGPRTGSNTESPAALVLDAGTGLGRLADPELRELLEPIERLDILLTHYHLDHVVGLSFLPGLWSGRAVRIFAPSPPLTVGGSEALDRLISPPLFPVGFSRWPLAVEIVPYSSLSLEIGPFSLKLRAQRHPGGSVGVRVGDALAYVTDTVLDRGTIDFVRGVGTLLHEVWLTDEEAQQDDAGRTGHSAAGPVADLARDAGVGRLVPIHHHPRRTAAGLDLLLAALAARAGCPVELPVEGRAIDLT
jgi:ribonuclease BN (tRNA processing enzyme)